MKVGDRHSPETIKQIRDSQMKLSPAIRAWRARKAAAAKWAKTTDRSAATRAARETFRDSMTPDERRSFYENLGRLRWSRN